MNKLTSSDLNSFTVYYATYTTTTTFKAIRFFLAAAEAFFHTRKMAAGIQL